MLISHSVLHQASTYSQCCTASQPSHNPVLLLGTSTQQATAGQPTFSMRPSSSSRSGSCLLCSSLARA